MHTHNELQKVESDLFSNIENKFTKDVLYNICEIQQSRSNFQLDYFVIGQHDTVEMQYYQTLLELQSIYYTVKIISLQIEKTKIEIKRLKESNDEIKHIDAKIKEVELEQLMVTAIGTSRELDKLLSIYHSFDKKYTRAELESAQVNYWEKRLYRQATLEAAAGGSSSQAAHLDSLRQIGVIRIDADGSIKTNVRTAIPEIE